MQCTLAWRQAGLGHACQSGNVAILLTSLFFVFKISLLPKYRVNYYNHIIKWCFGIQCNWCVSLDIAQILALVIKDHSSSPFDNRCMLFLFGRSCLIVGHHRLTDDDFLPPTAVFGSPFCYYFLSTAVHVLFARSLVSWSSFVVHCLKSMYCLHGLWCLGRHLLSTA